MNFRIKLVLALLICLAIMAAAVGIGSVYISPGETVQVIWSKITGTPTAVEPVTVGIIWNMRLPRVLLAFLVGAILSVCGAVMQSVLKNTLASAYTLGVSAGAAFGVALMVSFGIPTTLLGLFTMPVVGLVFGIITVILTVLFSAKMDRNMSNQTIVLVGMVFSLFINAMLTLISSLSKDTLQKMIYWQMGSVALKDWSFVFVLAPVAVVGILVLLVFSREMDNLTFGEEAAFVVGIEVKKVKWILLSLSAGLTGCAVALVGIIGFVDLIVPHVVRKIFGASHRKVLPMAAVLGGAFMVVADVIARTIVTPSELPIGAVTAIIGAPFFTYLYFQRRAAK